MTFYIKVYNPEGFERGGFHFYEDAAILLSGLEDRSTIRVNHQILYTSGVDGNPAESYDEVARICIERESTLEQEQPNANP